MGKNANTDGMLPKGWQKVRLHEVASVKTGPFGTQLHQHDYVQSDGTPIITVEHLSEKGLRHKNLPLVSDNDKQRLSQYLIHEGDIIFSRVGSVDRSALVKKDEDGWLFSGRLLRLRPRKDDVHSPYLNYFFHTKKFRHHMRSIAVGGIMPSINTNLLSNVFVQLPPLPEQKAIASLLEIWDTAI
ncbi:MAG: restriction endonuclease subunit S, partial [Gammaproteobacteria bacterium]|nr:restriction endonuclease subunit S [Gammaproteobacteria bacterium]